MSDPKIKYDIEAVARGEDSVQALSGALRSLGDVLEGDLQQSAQAAARDLDELGRKQRAVEEFGALKRESAELAAKLTQASAAVDKLAPELAQASGKAQQMAAAEKQAAAALEQARTTLTAKRAALKEHNAETDAATRRSAEFRGAQGALKGEIAAATAEVKKHRTELRAAQDQSTQAAAAERTLGAEYQRTVKSAAQLSLELGNKNRALAASRETLQAAGLATTNLAQSQRTLQTAVSEVRQRVLQMAPAYQQAAAASSASTQAQAQHQRTLRDGFTAISTQLQRVQQIAAVALGGSYVGGLARSVAQTADEFKNLQARVQLASGEGEAFQQAWEGVTQVALETNTALDETGTLFARLHKAAKEGGASAEQAQAQALSLTRTINQAVQLSGGSADAAKAAVTQLIQGLQSGVLRGEEFNSVMEQAPRLAQALADGLGVTTGQLREMAKAGELTASTVMRAMRDQAGTIEAEFGKLPQTVGRALQNLSTQWTLYVGSSDAGLVSTANAAKALNLLAENLDLVVTALTTAGKLWAATKVASLAADFGLWVQKTLAATTALEANTMAATQNAAAHTGLAAAQSRAALAQQASTAAVVANTAAQGKNAAAWAAIGGFTGAAAKATEAATGSFVAGTKAVAQKTTAMGLLGKAVGGVGRLLGGPVGLAATVAMFWPEIVRAKDAVLEWGFSFTESGKKLEKFQKTQEAEAEALKKANEERKRAAEAAQEQADAAAKAHGAWRGLTKEAQAVIASFDKMTASGDTAAAAIGKIGKDFDLSSVPGVRNASAVLDELVRAGKISAEQFRDAWADALKGQDLALFENRARTAMQTVKQEATQAMAAMHDAVARGLQGKELEAFELRVKQAFAAVKLEGERLKQTLEVIAEESLRRVGTSAEELKTGFSAAATSAINDLDALAQALDGMGVKGDEAGRLLEKAFDKALAVANTDRAVQALIERVAALGEQAGLTDEQTSRMFDKAKAKADEMRTGINSLAEAYKQLGIKAPEELKRIAEANRQAWLQVKNDSTATLATKQEAFKRYAQAAIDANGGVASSTLKAEATMLGLSIQADKTGKAIIKAMDEAGKAVDQLNQRATSLSSTWDRERKARAEHIAANRLPGATYDKDGWATDTKGNRITGGTYLPPPDDSDEWEWVPKLNQGYPYGGLWRNKRTGSEVSRPGASGLAGGSTAAGALGGVAPSGSGTSGLAAGTSSSTVPDSAGTGSSAGATGSTATRTVNINFNGRSLGSVKTDAAGDATLQRLLGELEAQATRAGP